MPLIKSEIRDLVFVGCLMDSTNTEDLCVRKYVALGVKNGKIAFVVDPKELEPMLRKHEMKTAELIKLTERQFLIPGLVDTHLHAPQYVFYGQGNGTELLPWLQTYTFPAEVGVNKDPHFAKEVYEKCVMRSLRLGTTTASYYATIGTDRTVQLAKIVDSLGQRAFIGKVNMDQNSPENYVETTEKSLSETERFIKEVLSLQSTLVTPCLTPRFAISCSGELMKGLSAFAKKYNLPIQTHISENTDEIEKVKELFKCGSYAEVYDKFGVLTDKTILAHGIYLTDAELQLVSERRSGISHCPNSNFSLASGFLNIRPLLLKNMKLGLGTDISGGNSLSVLDTIRRAAEAANLVALKLRQEKKPVTPITFKNLFKLATLGGCQVMGLDSVIGNFQEGKEFDALLVDIDAPNSTIDVFGDATMENLLEKFLFTGDERNIVKIYVQGREIVVN